MTSIHTISLRRLLWAASATMAAAFAGCQSEPSGSAPDDAESRVIAFSAGVRHAAAPATRDGHEANVEPEIEPMSSSLYNMDFFIELCCEAVADDGSVPNPGIYVVPSGYSSWLQAKETKQRLKWRDLRANHTFYGWNLPWTDSTYYQVIEEEDNKALYDPGRDLLPPLKVRFHDSAEGKSYEEFRNDSVYQYFVGVKRADVSYMENGQYVELVFKHLVSKIVIDKLSMIEGPHTVTNNLRADMTIYGMPRSATFYPHPSDRIAGSDGYPIVVADPLDLTQEDPGRTYHIINDRNKAKEDVFYVCPEIDFRDLVFEIKINDTNYSQYGSYWGSFSDVKFVRTAGTNYDEGGDETVLHAGEEMHLIIELYQGMGPGITVVIEPWSTDNPNGSEAVHHSHPGIYTDSEAGDIINLFSKANPAQEDIDNLLELYGEKDEQGDYTGTFCLYENITVGGSSFPLADGYTLNGLGHTIKMSSSTVRIGQMRDVYLTDGTNIIYIDNDGKVYKVDPKTYDMTPTGQLGAGNSFTINLKTGKVS